MYNPEWRKQGKCYGLNSEESDRFFFLGRGGSPMQTRAQFCDDCPVKKTCFEYAIVHTEQGIWGGTTDRERSTVAPFLKQRLTQQARQEGWLEERPKEPIVPQRSYTETIEFQLPQDILDDIDLNTYLQTGS